MAERFAALFVTMLALSTLLRAWLLVRQVRSVRAHREAVPAAFAARISLDEHRQAADYTLEKTRLALIALAAEALWLLLLTLGGWLASLASFWQRSLPDAPYLAGLMLIFSVALAGFLVDLPFSLWRTFVIEARFGFNKTTPALFLIDLVKSLLLAALFGAPLVLTALWLVDALGAHWWLGVWAVWLGFNLLLLWLYPTVIAPLFNKFVPLAEGEVKSRIEALLARCGFSPAGLFVMDGSKRSAHGNAYFPGFGAARRIVFFDTLLEKLAPSEIEAVLAHELGHFKRRHVAKRLVLMAAVSLGLLWLLGALIDEPWFYAGLGAGGTAPTTALALLLFVLVLPVFAFPLTPLFSALSRRHEFEADAFAAQQTSAADLVQALVKLYRDNAATLTPDPLYSLFHDSHPPAAARIARLTG
ncbi:MAG: M48 family metallopeptidase [Rhodocyclaceae bacterium]|nr:M48 family metallopeptidase [Rhodocyclaceae bacterium]